MKTTIGNYLPLLVLSTSMLMSANAFAQNDKDLDHEFLVVKYENLAQKAQAIVSQQKELFKKKPRTSFFGRNGQDAKKRVSFRIQKYEKVASEHLKQANYHRQLAQYQNDLEFSINPTTHKSKVAK